MYIVIFVCSAGRGANTLLKLNEFDNFNCNKITAYARSRGVYYICKCMILHLQIFLILSTIFYTDYLTSPKTNKQSSVRDLNNAKFKTRALIPSMTSLVPGRKRCKSFNVFAFPNRSLVSALCTTRVCLSSFVCYKKIF